MWCDLEQHGHNMGGHIKRMEKQVLKKSSKACLINLINALEEHMGTT